MPREIEMLANPEVLLVALIILGALVVILRFVRPNQGRPQQGRARPEAQRDRMPASAPEAPPATVGRASDLAARHPSVTFADIAGLDDAIAELREATEYLSDPDRFRALGAELPRGILLHGGPGCGKTLLARALAGETGVPFFFVSAASFVEQYVGLGAARVRQLFEEAKSSAPSIIFIDELDAIGRQRNASTSGDREFDHTLNQLLVELDGFEGSSGVLILGATNRPELIDPALLRPGRFDRRIHIDRPDKDGREKILRLHATKRPFSSRVDWEHVAANTAGLSAAELANMVNEAALLAARRHRQMVAPEDLEEACARVLAGTRTSRLMSAEEKQLVAVHEAGHAVLSLLVKGVNPPPRISVVSRGSSFSRSNWSSVDDREILTRRELMAQLIVLLGGRAAELNSFGEPSTRAEDDLEHAAKLARRMVGRWAMTGRFELAGRGPETPSHHLEGTESSQEVKQLLARSEQAARAILREHSRELHTVARALAEQETLSRAELEQLTGRATWRAPVREVSSARRVRAV